MDTFAISIQSIFWTVPISHFLSVFFLHGEARLATTFVSVLDHPAVYITNGMSWTGCPRSYLGSHCHTKREEASPTKEGTGEEGCCMIVLACISSVLFAMHLYDKASTAMPATLMLVVHFCCEHVEISEQLWIDQNKYTNDSDMGTGNIRLAISSPILHPTLRALTCGHFKWPGICPWADRSCPPRQTSALSSGDPWKARWRRPCDARSP